MMPTVYEKKIFNFNRQNPPRYQQRQVNNFDYKLEEFSKEIHLNHAKQNKWFRKNGHTQVTGLNTLPIWSLRARVKNKGNGAPGAIRTRDLWLRRPILYPAELQVRSGLQQILTKISTKTRQKCY